MSDRARNLRVGAFALGALVILVAALLAFGLREQWEPKVRFETAIGGDVVGLAVGSAVELRGIPVGKVTSIGFTWTEYPGTRTDLACVRFEVRRNVLPPGPAGSLDERIKEQIARGLRVRIRSQALTGTSVLAVERVNPAQNPAPTIDYEPRDRFLPSATSQFTRMLDAIERTLDALKEIKFAPVVERTERLIGAVEAVLRQIEKLRIDRIEQKVNVAVDEVVLSTKDLHAGIVEGKRQIEQLGLDKAGESLRGLLGDLRKATTQLEATFRRVEGVDVEGLNEAIISVKRASDQLDQALGEVRDYPAGSLLGKPPGPPPSLEPEKGKKK